MNTAAAPAKPPIRAVLLDYGMVLSGPPNPEAWARMRAISTLGEEDLHREYWKHRHPYDRGTHTGRAYWQLVGKGGGLVFTPEQVAGLIDADTDLWTDLNLPMVEWARQLQAAGIPTGILSNIGDAMEEGVRRKFDWIGGFTHCTWSHTLKLAKPEATIYSHAADGLELPPENILFIDDRADNLEAARAFGMQVIQYGEHATFLEEMHAHGYADLLSPALPSTDGPRTLRM